MAKVTDQPELTAAPAATDMFLVSEISSGLSKKINFSRMISGYRNFTTGAWTLPAPSSGVTLTVVGAAGSDPIQASLNEAATRYIAISNAHASGATGVALTSAAAVVGLFTSDNLNSRVRVGANTDHLTQIIQGGVAVISIAATTRAVSVAAPASGKCLAADGEVNVASSTATPAGGTAGKGLTFGTTANLGVFFGSGAPTLSAAQGSLYMRTDGSSTSTRLYVNTNGTTGWTNVTTAT